MPLECLKTSQVKSTQLPLIGCAGDEPFQKKQKHEVERPITYYLQSRMFNIV